MTMRVLNSQEISQNEQGSALVYTLMVLLLLSLLGLSVGMVTVGSYRLSDSNRDYTSAYYIAEAGANQVNSDFTKKVNDLYTESTTKDSFIVAVNKEVSDLKGKSFTYREQFNEEVKGIINVTGNFNDGYTFISEGIIGNKTRTVETDVKVNWIEKSGPITLPSLPPDAAILARNKLLITNGTLEGAAYISSKNRGAVYLTGGQGGNKGSIIYPEGVTLEHIIEGSNVYKPTLKMVSRNEPINWTAYNEILKKIKLDFNKPVELNKNNLGRLQKKEITDGYTIHNVVTPNGSVYVNNWMVKHHDIELDANKYIPKLVIETGKSANIILNKSNITLAFDEIVMESGSRVRIKGLGDAEIHLNKLDLQASGTNLDLEVDGKLTIFVDDLKVMSSSININNNKNVTIIVNKTMTFNQTSLINSTKGPEQLLFVYRGATPNFSNLTTINANIFSINNTAPMTIKDSEINGVFVTDSKSVTYSGGNGVRKSDMLLIAPLANIELGEGYNIAGALLGNEVKLSGGGALTSKKIDTSGFYFESTNEGGFGDLIITSPIIEPN